MPPPGPMSRRLQVPPIAQVLGIVVVVVLGTVVDVVVSKTVVEVVAENYLYRHTVCTSPNDYKQLEIF